MSQKETVERALRFANHPTPASWLNLVGEAGIVGARAAEPYTIGEYFKRSQRAGGASTSAPLPEHIKSSAERLQAALSDIAHARQTRAQLEAWEAAARRLTPTPSRVIEGKRVREAILWSAPREVLELPDLEAEWRLVTVDTDSLTATVLIWLLNPDLKFTGPRQAYSGLHECRRGPKCTRERFHFRNRRYCCRECGSEQNAATSTQRSRDRRERARAVELLKPRFPTTAKKYVWQVKAPGLTAEQLVERAQAAASRKRN